MYQFTCFPSDKFLKCTCFTSAKVQILTPAERGVAGVGIDGEEVEEDDECAAERGGQASAADACMRNAEGGDSAVEKERSVFEKEGKDFLIYVYMCMYMYTCMFTLICTCVYVYRQGRGSMIYTYIH